MDSWDRLRHRLEDHVVVCDGAIGSELLPRLPDGADLDLAPLEHPDLVLEIHLAYLEAGAELIATATFAASPARLAKRGARDQAEELNATAVKLAREARETAGGDCLVAGAIGPLANHVDLDSASGRTAIAEAHAEQAAILAGRGADLLVLETFFRRDELELAIDSIQAITDLPVVAFMSFPSERSPHQYGAQAAELERVADRRVLAIGVNCAPGPHSALSILRHVGDVGVPLAAMPNAGVWVRRHDRLVLPPSTPAYLADFARDAVAAGAALVGGCCGTGPDHIRAIAEAVAGTRPRPASKSASARLSVASAPAPSPRPAPASNLAAKIREGRFVTVVQLDPPKGTNSDAILRAAERLADHGGVDAVDVNSNPLARLRMDSLWLAAEIERVTGLETIPHVTPRDASPMGVQASLLGAWRSGIRNLLTVTGDPSQLGDYPGAHDVYQIDIFELIRDIARMAEGRDCAGNPIGAPPSFLIGVAVNPCAEDLPGELDRLRRKVDAGAHFAMSQVLFDWKPWQRLLDLCGGRSPLPMLAPIWPLTSLRLALRLHHEVPGIVVPDDLLAALEAAGADASRVGRERARTMLSQAPRHAAGVYLIAPFKRSEAVLELLDEC